MIDFEACGASCLFRRFFSDSREAMFVTSREGRYLVVNESMERLLGYGSGELVGLEVRLTLDSEEDREDYQNLIESEGVVHDYRIALRRRDGTIAFCLIDAIVWREEGRTVGYYGLIRTESEIVDSFREYFDQLKRERQRLREERRDLVADTMLLSRYLTDDLIEYVRRTGKDPLTTLRRKATILFFDIRNSTGIAEKLEPEAFARFLSDIFTDIMDLIYGAGGSVNKLLGDGLLATFGCPLSSGDDAYNAVAAAKGIRDYLSTLNDVRPEGIEEPIWAGMGIATGTVFSGVIGSVRREEYTVLGDAVNLASRIQTLTRKANEPILIDDATFLEVSSRIECRAEYRGRVRGRERGVTIYCVA